MLAARKTAESCKYQHCVIQVHALPFIHKRSQSAISDEEDSQADRKDKEPSSGHEKVMLLARVHVCRLVCYERV